MIKVNEFEEEMALMASNESPDFTSGKSPYGDDIEDFEMVTIKQKSVSGHTAISCDHLV